MCLTDSSLWPTSLPAPAAMFEDELGGVDDVDACEGTGEGVNWVVLCVSCALFKHYDAVPPFLGAMILP